MRNTKTPQGTETVSCIHLQNTPLLIEKYEDPAGDGNEAVKRFGGKAIIEKYEDPAGDGNRTAIVQ